jgi:hypothetical protein
MKSQHKSSILLAGFLAAALLVLTVAVAAQDDPDPHFTSIDYPDAAFTVANAVNVNGDIVGLFRLRTATGSLAPPRGFVFSGEIFTPVQVPGAARTRVFGINDLGDIVGDYLAGGINNGFVKYAGSATFQTIRFTDGAFASPNTDSWGIDNDRNITGGYVDAMGHTIAYIWNDGTFTNSFQAPFANTTVTYTHGLNAKGEVVGCFWTGDTEMHSLRIMPDGTYRQEDFPDSMMSMHWRISKSSIIVGHYVDMMNLTHGYLMKNGDYESIDFPNASSTLAKGIAEVDIENKTGRRLGSRILLIVGQYDDANGTHGYLFTRRIGVGKGE